MVLQKSLINADDVCMVVDASWLVSTGENGGRERTDEVGERSWALNRYGAIFQAGLTMELKCRLKERTESPVAEVFHQSERVSSQNRFVKHILGQIKSLVKSR